MKERYPIALRSGAIALWLVMPLILLVLANANPAPLRDVSPLIQIHLFSSLGALWFGGVLLLWSKGRRFHRGGGWVWTCLLVVAAGTSLFITTVNPGHWSIVHGLSVVTLLALIGAVWAARSHRVKTHRIIVYGLFVIALGSEFASSFLPGRLLHSVFLA